MSPETLQVVVLIAAGAALALVPVLIILLASRIKSAAHETARMVLLEATKQHQHALGDFRQQYDGSLDELTHKHDRAIDELTRQHERTLGEYARQHQRALAELGSEHMRIAQEFGMFSRKRHQVYARLYARYRRATHEFMSAIGGEQPEFQKYARDDLLRYLSGRRIRERDAADAIAAMDRGDLFAMGKLMTKLHWRATLRDANVAFEQAHQYESLNELYLSEPVRESVGNVRRIVEALSYMLSREQERAEQAKRIAKQDELTSAVASLLHTMRADLSSGSDAVPTRRVTAPARAQTPASLSVRAS